MSESYELRPAAGQGQAFFTERVIFYLQHRDQIDQWAKLQYEAAPAISQFMESLRAEVQDRAAPWGVWTGTLRKYRCLMSSPFRILTERHPPAGIALGWHHAVPATPETPTPTCPFAGVYADADSELHDRVLAALEARDAGDGIHGFGSTERWPRFEYVTGEVGWWTDLDGYREKLLSSFEGMFRRYQDVIAAAAPVPPPR